MNNEELNYLKEKILNQHKENRVRSLDSAEKIYSELNRSEFIVITGSFALVLNFLIGNKNLDHLPLLNIGILFFVITIVIKSLSYRRAADIREKEIDISDDMNNLDSKFFIIAEKLTKKDQISAIEEEEFLGYKKKSNKLYSDFNNLKIGRKTGKILNETEYFSYLIGLVFIIGFFILNMIK